MPGKIDSTAQAPTSGRCSACIQWKGRVFVAPDWIRQVRVLRTTTVCDGPQARQAWQRTRGLQHCTGCLTIGVPHDRPSN